MQILRVFNNNVVLAKQADGEVVVTGRGIGFGARHGDTVDKAKVHKVFVPADGRDPDHLGEMLAMIPGEVIAIVNASLEEVGVDPTMREKITLVTALADHVAMAIKRQAEGQQIEYPLEAEVRHLYPEDLALAQRLLQAINRRLNAPLPDSEAIAFTLHFVNANFASGDLSYTYKMTGVIEQILDVIGAHYGIELDSSFISVARFITHMRYLFVRLATKQQLTEGSPELSEQIRTLYPEASTCAHKIANIVELRFDSELSDEEIAYLTLHTERLGTHRKDT
ncbi:PRD domain-containing protein [Corynebacterium breve]|uniref:PRD domain-containing protein n=1 Tax=Corynebacterium breve TaxID=3049799 RepID=A0ABY8VEH2_9CORY|nr:PRD domain-containing protein [Corynebacterium breve]WIM67356.1 PRD domain-containing protein [Corynebacterium breve]